MFINWLMNANSGLDNVAGAACRETLRPLSAKEGKPGFPQSTGQQSLGYRHKSGGLMPVLSGLRSPLS